MRVLVIGASGQTGRHVVRLLLAEHHDVTAFTRPSSPLNGSDPRLRVVHGDARDARSLERAVANQDAVVSCFGPNTLAKTDLQEVLMRHLVTAMTKAAVKRLVNLSAWGSGGEAVPPSPFARYVLIPILLHRLLADKRRGEVHLFGSALDYVNVCPGALKNAPGVGRLKASIDGKGLKQYAHREDVAAFMVGQLTERTWVRKCVAVGY
jgi:NAD(P)-dependent dehydrogenase (short-subunit alcohol dehydrogenase family)